MSCPSVIHKHNEVQQIGAALGAVPVRDFQPKILVFYICQHLGMIFGHATEFPFPVAVEDDPVDVALFGVCLPEVLF